MSTAVDQNLDLVPEIVRRKAAEMEAFIKGETATMTGEVPAGQPEPAKAAEPAPAEPTPSPAPVKAAEAPPETAPGTSEPAKTEPAVLEEPVPEEMKKEQRYKIMDGMLKASGRDLRQARAELQAVRDEMEALKRQITAPAAAPVTVSGTPKPSPSDPEMVTRLAEALGESNLKDMVTYLRSQGFAVTDDLKKVEEQVGTMSQQVGAVSKTVTMSAQERFAKEMNDFTNNKWESINSDPKFIEWMGEEDGYSGLTRREAAQNHANRMDAPRLARYFVDYLENHAKSVVPESKPKIDKRSLASPPATPAADTKLDDQPKMVKLSEFTQFAADVRNGRYSSLDPEKHKQLQAKMFAEQERLDNAQRLGHVVTG